MADIKKRPEENDFETTGGENTVDSQNQPDGKDLTVEESFARLDEMVKKLESDDVSLEESFELYQEGMKLLKSVHAKIEGYEKKMQLLTEDGVLEDFE